MLYTITEVLLDVVRLVTFQQRSRDNYSENLKHKTRNVADTAKKKTSEHK